MKHELKKVDPLAAGKVMGLLYTALMLLLVPFSLVFIVAGCVALAKDAENGAALIGMGVFFFFSPLLYGVFGFIFGALGALAYNLIAWKCGGLVFESVPRE